jgi:AhpD family alkylhydroperoxidase
VSCGDREGDHQQRHGVHHGCSLEPPLDNPIATKSLKYIIAAGRAVSEPTLPSATQELVALRASQINGCGACVDMHTKEVADAGETSLRLNLIAAWREATVFTEAERGALELAEQGTRIADAAAVSRTRSGRMRPGIMTRTSSPAWCCSSPS